MRKKLLSNLKNDNSSGELMIEATIVTIITIMVLIFLIAIGFLIYQQVMMSDVANEAATAVARNYKFTSRDSKLVSDENLAKTVINDEYYKRIKKYRSTFGLNKMRNVNADYTKNYINARLPVTSMSYDNNLDVNTEINSTTPGRVYATVTISMDAQLLFDGVLSYGGMDSNSTKLSASASAECLDITGYAGMVNYQHYLAQKGGDKKAKFNDSIKNIKDIIEMLNNNK